MTLPNACPKPRVSKKTPTQLHRRTRVKRENRKRRSANWLRAYGSEERVAWIRQRYCVTCGFSGCENAHVLNGGRGRKADACWIVPLCRDCHGMLHRVGRDSFERAMNINLEATACVIQVRWLAHISGPESGALSGGTREKDHE